MRYTNIMDRRLLGRREGTAFLPDGERFFLFIKIPWVTPTSTHHYYYHYDKYNILYTYLTPVSAFQKLLAYIVVKPADRTRHNICPLIEVIIWFGIFSRAEVGEAAALVSRNNKIIMIIYKIVYTHFVSRNIYTGTIIKNKNTYTHLYIVYVYNPKAPSSIHSVI